MPCEHITLCCYRVASRSDVDITHALVKAIEAVGTYTLRGKGAVLNVDVDVVWWFGAALFMPANDGVRFFTLCRYEGAVQHIDVDITTVCIVFMPTQNAVRTIPLSGESGAPHIDVDITHFCMPAKNAVRLFPLCEGSQALHIDIKITRASMPAKNAGGKSALCGGRGILHINSDLPSAVMKAPHAPLFPNSSVNCDAVQVDIDVIGGSRGFLTIDSFPGCGHVAAHGGGLRLCLAHAEAERDRAGRGERSSEGG